MVLRSYYIFILLKTFAVVARIGVGEALGETELFFSHCDAPQRVRTVNYERVRTKHQYAH